MLLFLLLQVLQAWLEALIMSFNGCFTYFKLSSNWLLPTLPFPLLFFPAFDLRQLFHIPGLNLFRDLFYSQQIFLERLLWQQTLFLCVHLPWVVFVKVPLCSVLIWLALPLWSTSKLGLQCCSVLKQVAESLPEIVDNECLFSVNWMVSTAELEVGG